MKVIDLQSPSHTSLLGPGGENGRLILTWVKESISPWDLRSFNYRLYYLFLDLSRSLLPYSNFGPSAASWISSWNLFPIKLEDLLIQCDFIAVLKDLPCSLQNLTLSSYKTQLISQELWFLGKKSYFMPLYFPISTFFWKDYVPSER